MKQVGLLIGLLSVIIICVLLALFSPFLDVWTSDLRYGLLHDTQQYQTGLETEVLQMQQEYFGIEHENCPKKEAVKNLIEQKYQQLNNPSFNVVQNMNKIQGDYCEN